MCVQGAEGLFRPQGACRALEAGPSTRQPRGFTPACCTKIRTLKAGRRTKGLDSSALLGITSAGSWLLGPSQEPWTWTCAQFLQNTISPVRAWVPALLPGIPSSARNSIPGLWGRLLSLPSGLSPNTLFSEKPFLPTPQLSTWFLYRTSAVADFVHLSGCSSLGSPWATNV